MKLAERIRQARRKANLSQIRLAEQLKVQRSAVSNWESASDTFPTMPNLVAIAKVCDVSLEWLGTGRGRMKHQDVPDEAPVLDADIVELPSERKLLVHFRGMSAKSKDLLLELAAALDKKAQR